MSIFLAYPSIFIILVYLSIIHICFRLSIYLIYVSRLSTYLHFYYLVYSFIVTILPSIFILFPSLSYISLVYLPTYLSLSIYLTFLYSFSIYLTHASSLSISITYLSGLYTYLYLSLSILSWISTQCYVLVFILYVIVSFFVKRDIQFIAWNFFF